ncbi:type I-E CRISPR-associated endonuclease Cas1, partial [Salmonella enterica subsp. enterica serovar Typhimurium]|nr:type I-E CRISPR-associated endonuclease Cas1 [Salmonella enterica subsp. enterica serovar Typhimurium]
RSDLRKLIVKNKILEEMLQILMTILTPYLPARNDDRLIGGRNREVAGHTQYA